MIRETICCLICLCGVTACELVAGVGDYSVFGDTTSAAGGGSTIQPVWSVVLEGGRVEPVAVARTSSNGVWVAGSFQGELNVYDKKLESAGGWDMFVVLLSDDGLTVTVAKSYGDSSDQRIEDATVDANGNLIVVGTIAGRVEFDEAYESEGNGDVFVAAIAPDGTEQWAVAFGDADAQRGLAIALSAETVLVGGEFAGSIEPYASPDAQDIDGFVVELNVMDGDLVESQVFGDLDGAKGSDQRVRAVAFGQANRVVCGEQTFGVKVGDPLVGKVDARVFHGHLNANLDPVKAGTFDGGGADDRCTAVASHGGNWVLTGSYDGDFGDRFELAKSSGRSAFVVAVDGDAEVLWGLRIGETVDTQEVNGLVSLENGSLIVVGQAAGIIDVNGKSYDAGTSSRAFAGVVVGEELTVMHFLGSGAVATAVAPHGDSVVVTGHFSESLDVVGSVVQNEGQYGFVMVLGAL